MAATQDVDFPQGLRADGLPAALDDSRRLAAVAATGLMDTGPEDVFDDLARLAASVTGCGRAFITLVDAQRSFWKSCVGVDLDRTEDRQGPVRESFCYFLVGLEGEPFAVKDAAADPRTQDHPSVGPMRIGAWAGYPVLSPDGEVLGSMCVIDDDPHDWQPGEMATLATLARAVGNELHLRASLATTRRALSASTELARSLQETLLPPLLPPVPGVQAAASYLPAQGGQVVGDFYDLFRAKGNWWCTVMGDVCGKGVEAAKITTLARYTLRAEATQHLSPATVLTHLNSALLAQHDSDRFLTAVYGTFRPTPTGVAGRLCTAGHPPALIRRADGRIEELGRPGTLLGVFPEIHIQDVRFRLTPGDTLLLYTDGATEARALRTPAAAQPALFGEDAFARAFAECHDMAATQIVARLGEALATHSHGYASDDTALLALRVPPADDQHVR
ncbi:PP2C family protein-serine/threonine phosphatase [Streptomyces antibioticus]|uniref:PP2C family protein-serine/threonine phosphatase n=1 Tax=Streptomyces antibioticus TaxID=1890 RepID=UPI00369DB625